MRFGRSGMIPRREFLKAGGAIVVSFAFAVARWLRK